MVLKALKCGHTAFGENYAQELEQKSSLIHGDNIQWHFIGPIQSNKTQIIATHADWVHSLDRVKIAKRLSSQRPEELPPLQICIQVNLDQETSKSGVPVSELEKLCDAISALNHIKIRGLMCIPKASSSFDRSRRSFEKLRLALESLTSLGHNLDTLSMGMSGDFEAAIAEGATIVRIGTAIFGQRG
jgi:pyridoxal phosphate enzyme (YggS family)